ncbi:Ig-like domain repeat protein [Streptomyces sp. GQFP]|uniref:Ig-like domain repeat protein n=1 Tax=Streptomyces sp. GQFP TaxID=2907545 RepID=UPI001F395F01|nr:Ig-like domain repeat protein [Streptomyces sp. GQFP]UIX32549.1 Ig-like domain repeat protein [Streptomyces sp. GQFP]
MRTRSTSAATALAVIFSSAALSIVAAGSASAQTVVVTTPVGLVADGPLQRVFVADQDNGRVLATDYSGTLVGVNVGFDGVRDLAVSDDGATVYAVLADSHEIVALDAAALGLGVKARYDIGVGTDPRDLAFAGGRLWFSYKVTGEDGVTHGNLGSVDPTVDPAGEVSAVSLGLLPEEVAPYYNSALLDTDLSTPGLLTYTDSGASEGALNVLDVSGAAPRVVAKSSATSYVGDVDLIPGASEVLVNGNRRLSYASGELTEAGGYPVSSGYGDVSPSGLVAHVYGGEVSVFRPGSDQLIRSVDADAYGAGRVIWAPDAPRLFAMTSNVSGTRYTLKAFTDATLSAPNLTVSAPGTAPRAKKLTVTGRITATLPFPAGTKLAVTRKDTESPNGKALPAVTVKADGTYSFTDTPQTGGGTTYKVTYAGDAEHTAATASDRVEVPFARTALTLNNNGKLYNYGADVKFTAHLGLTYKNRTVEIWSDPHGTDKPKKLIKSGKVNSAGNLTVTVDMTRDTNVSAVFKGDTRFEPKTVQVTARARVKISTAVSRHYRTAKIGSVSYHWFHKNTDPLLTTSMPYYKGRKQRLDLQVFYQGSWYTTASEYFAVATNGKSAVRLGAPGESGIRARIRSVYVDGGSGDNVNSTTFGSWKYLYFSN